MKMYILVRESIPTGHAINSVGHATLACFLKFAAQRSMQRWLADSFKKVVCKVSDEEYKAAYLAAESSVIITESALNDEPVCIAFAPREEWPEIFKTFKLYS